MSVNQLTECNSTSEAPEYFHLRLAYQLFWCQLDPSESIEEEVLSKLLKSLKKLNITQKFILSAPFSKLHFKS